MGELGQRIVREDLEAVRRVLMRAFSDEWFAHYNFRFVAGALRGHRAPDVVDFLRRRSDVAIARADRLAARLAEIGGMPPAKMGEMTEHASDKPFKLPASLADVDGVLRAVLDAERASLRTYDELAELSARGDRLTHRLAVDVLADAVRAEQEIERLIDDAAPGMTGR
jgi:ferritin-like protein